MRALPIILIAMALAGCASTGRAVVPASLLQCAAQPKSPADKPGVTERDVALYIIDLAASGEDCRSKLGSVRRILSGESQ